MAPRPSPSSAAAAVRCLAIAALVACDGGNGGDDGDADALLVQVQDADYRAWARPPVGAWMLPLQPSHAPHGAFVDVYLNDVSSGVFAGEPGALVAWPEGSIFVLDGWEDDAGSRLAFIAILEKRADGWAWEEYLGDALERPTYSGAPQVCVSCHASGVDFVRSVALP